MHAALGARETKMTKKNHRPDFDIRDFPDLQDHRYDPGYWPTQWYQKGRSNPEIAWYKQANLGNFLKAVLIFLFLGFPLVEIALDFSEGMPYRRTIITIAFLGVFLAIYAFIVKVNRHNEKKKCK